MNVPNLERVIETFIPITIPNEATSLQIWQHYLNILRSKVEPLVKDLMQRRLIDWYSFLVHSRQSGVPISEDDKGIYVHLRVELSALASEQELRKHLPPFCRMTQKMVTPKPPSLDTIDIQALRDEKIEQGWKVLGEASEWVLRMLNSHSPNKPVPAQNVAQFLHYIGNQLFIKAVQIPMP